MCSQLETAILWACNCQSFMMVPQLINASCESKKWLSGESMYLKIISVVCE